MTGYELACREILAREQAIAARDREADRPVDPVTLRAIRQWRRRLHWARFGRYYSALVGVTVGGTLGIVLMVIVLRAIEVTR